MTSGYSCPVCGERDTTAYQRCYHPGCPDGRDPGHPHRTLFYPHSLPPVSGDRRKVGFWRGVVVGLTFSFILYFVLKGVL